MYKKRLGYVLFALAAISLSIFSGCNIQTCSNGLQDNGETGVDCGGNCAPCPAIPANLLGTWNQVSASDYSNNQATVTYVDGAACKIEITNQPTSGSNYMAYGIFDFCSYPTEFPSFNYNQANSSLNNGSLVIKKLTADSLILGRAGQNYIMRYIKAPNPYIGAAGFVHIEISIPSGAPQGGFIVRDVLGGGMVTDTILTGQTFYTCDVNQNSMFGSRVELLSWTYAYLPNQLTFRVKATDIAGNTLLETPLLSSNLGQLYSINIAW